MADKKLERRYLNRTFEILGQQPDGEIQETETPDFLVCVDGNTLGVEVTAFHPSEPDRGQPHRARLGMRQLAVEQARRAFRATGGHALYVKVFFRTDSPLRRKRAYELGPLIADAIASVPLPKSIHDGGVTVQHPFVPPEVVTIHIHGSVSATDELWQAARAEWEMEWDSAIRMQMVRCGEVERQRAHLKQVQASGMLVVADQHGNPSPIAQVIQQHDDALTKAEAHLKRLERYDRWKYTARRAAFLVGLVAIVLSRSLAAAVGLFDYKLL